MKVKKLFFAALLLCVSLCTYAQTEIGKGKAPVVGLKTNLPYWGTATFNAGLEFRLAKKWSLDIEAGFNPFDGKNDDGTYDRSLKHLRIQPELRYWFCEANNGHFLGLHVPYYLYNVADVKLIGLEDERREGWGAGVGLSYGYQWMLSKHWSMGGDRRGRVYLLRIRPLPLYRLRQPRDGPPQKLFRSHAGRIELHLSILTVNA